MKIEMTPKEVNFIRWALDVAKNTTLALAEEGEISEEESQERTTEAQFISLKLTMEMQLWINEQLEGEDE